jgi:aryl-alcohol dehydrogenase-like predicted oxidoreductase
MRKMRATWSQEMKRRDFIKGTVAASALTAAALPSGVIASGKSFVDMPYRKLGRTGENVSLLGIGGAHLGKPKTDAEAVRIVRTAIDNGVNFMDNSWDYNGGNSELRMGKALRDGYRRKVFLMTKIDGQDAKTAQQQLDESLQRLQTDYLDLLQFHEIIRMSDPDHVFADGGAIEALTDARNAGKIRYIGFTGHKDPHIHLKMLATAQAHDFRFDAVQMPLNVMDAHYQSFQHVVLPVLIADEIGVLAMKPMGGGIILESKTVSAIECLHSAMNLPATVVITGCDSAPVLNQALEAARTFHPMTDAQTRALLIKTAPLASEGRFELYKTSHIFDGTWQNSKLLGVRN